MPMQVFSARVRGGTIVPEDGVTLPEGATVTVIPSAYESFSLVALEAAAAGCPVVLSSTCGVTPLFAKTSVPIVPATADFMPHVEAYAAEVLPKMRA